jgi:hypothetical protein
LSALYVEFIELPRVVDPGQRELLARFLRVAVLGVDVDRGLEEGCFVQAVQLVLDRLGGVLGARHLSLTAAFLAFQICSTDSLSSRM